MTFTYLASAFDFWHQRSAGLVSFESVPHFSTVFGPIRPVCVQDGARKSTCCPLGSASEGPAGFRRSYRSQVGLG
jgi:hypothetical protein